MDLISKLENTQNGSELLIDDSKENYNKQWTRNLEIFLGIVFVSVCLGKLFKSNASVSKI